MLVFNVDKIDSKCQFYQRFFRAFFVQKSFLCLEFGFERTFVKKMLAKNIDEIDTRIINANER